MKVLVCGSRDWDDITAIQGRLFDLRNSLDPFDTPTIIHGGARGADDIAARAAAGLGFDIEVHTANWDVYGKRAGYLRNIAMLDRQPDLVIAFQRNRSRGTQHTIDEARGRGILVEVHTA